MKNKQIKWPDRYYRCHKKFMGRLLLFLFFFQVVGLELTADTLQQSDKTVVAKGVVVDIEGTPLIGASVTLQGKANIGTITDVDGVYEISVPQNSKLLISYIGFKSQTVKANDRAVIKTTLQEDTSTLDEVVVVGYGTQKKANLSGAVASVDNKVLEMRPVTNMSSALQGAVAGVNITPSSGNPSASPSINIRGYTSVTGAGPLVLVDGVEMDMALVNPQDIESVSVLKDAAASSIYGVKAAYGVVLVTTKSGSTAGGQNKLRINYSNNFSWGKPTVFPEMIDNSYDNAVFINQALENEGLAPLYRERQLAGIKAYKENPIENPEYAVLNGRYEFYGYHNWIDMMLKDYRPKQTHNLSVSGGSGKTTFYTSYAYTRDEGYFKVNPDIFRRNNFRVSLENQTFDWMKFGVKVSYGARKYDEPYNYKDNSWHQVLFTSPSRPNMWNGDPDHPEYDQYIGMYFDDQNPVSLQKLGGRSVTRRKEFTVMPSITITPLKDWNIHADFSYQRYDYSSQHHRKEVKMIRANFVPTLGNTSQGSFTESSGAKNYYSFNAYTDYEITLKEKHYLKGLIGFNQELTTDRSSGGRAYDLVSDDFPNTGLANGQKETFASGYEWALRGGFARLNYIYDNKYLVEINGRYDGTSRFPKRKRFAFLPSFSLAWRLSEEKFMEFSKPLFDNIKLRMSYGKLGNQKQAMYRNNVKDSYSYIPFMTYGHSTGYLFDGKGTQLYINPASMVAGDLTWEKAATLNGGIDLTLLDSRLNATFDIYRRTTSDMLYRRDYPALLGTSAPYQNGGEVQTTGWELELKWADRIGEDFFYKVGFSIYDSTAKITKWPGKVSNVNDLYKGKKMGEIWGYVCEGIIQDEETLANSETPNWGSKWGVGDLYFKNIDGKPGINSGANLPGDSGDKVVIGNSTPRYRYNITLSAEYKGIFFSSFFQGVGKRDALTTSQAFRPVGTQYYITQKWHIKESWTPENRNTYFPKARARNTQNFQSNSRYVQDGSYLRLKNLTLGYNIPTKWVKKVKLNAAKFYFSGENLFEFDHVKGSIDPEGLVNSGGNYYPFTRSYSIGMDLTF